MGLFGKKKDGKSKYKPKRELKAFIKQAESDAKKFNLMKQVGNAAAEAAIQGGIAGATAGVVDAQTKYMPIVDREKQTTDEQDYDRGDYENSYGPGRKKEKVTLVKTKKDGAVKFKKDGEAKTKQVSAKKAKKKEEKGKGFVPTGNDAYILGISPGAKYGHDPSKLIDPPSAAKKGVMDADTEDDPINTDEKEGAYVYSPGTKALKGDQDELPIELQEEILMSAANKRMGNMVAKAYGTPLPPSHERKPSTADVKKDSLNIKADYTTSGLPEFLYREDGTKIDTEMIDEGNLSGIHRVHKDGPYVTPNEGGTTGDDKVTYNRGEKLFIKNPMAASQYKMPPAQNRKPSKAQAKADAAKKEAEARARRGKK